MFMRARHVRGARPVNRPVSASALLCVALAAALLAGSSAATADGPPPNDNFSNAQVIGSPFGSVSGSIADATAENPCGPNVVPSATNPCEPNHGTPADAINTMSGVSPSGVPTGCWGGSCAAYPNNSSGYPNPALTSVWFTWKAPAAGSVEFTTTGSAFDTVLSVYELSDASQPPGFANLTLVAGNDDCHAQTGVGHLSCLGFPAVSGQTYWIALDQGCTLFGGVTACGEPTGGYAYVLNWLQGGALASAPMLSPSLAQQTISGALTGSVAIYGWTPPPGTATVATTSTCTPAGTLAIESSTVDATGTLSPLPGAQITGGQVGSFSFTANGLTEYYVLVEGGTNTGAYCFNASQAIPAELSMVDSSSPAIVTSGGAYAYTLTATNTGAAAAVGATISDILPAAATFTPPAGCMAAGQTVTCPVTLAANGGSATVTISATAPNEPVTTQIYDSATVRAANAVWWAASTTTTVLGGADLSLTDSVSPATVPTGGLATFTLVAANAGPVTAQAVSLSDTIPAGTTFASASTGCTNAAGVVTCSLGSLASEASSTVTINVLVPSGATITSAADSALVTSTTNDPNPANNTASASATVTARITGGVGCNAAGQAHGDAHWSFTGAGGQTRDVHVEVDALCRVDDHDQALIIDNAHLNIDGDAAAPKVNAHTDPHSNDITGVTFVDPSDVIVSGSFNGVPFAIRLHDGHDHGNQNEAMQIQYAPLNALPGLSAAPTHIDVDIQIPPPSNQPTIASGPVPLTTVTNATVDFSYPDPTVTFVCSLDGVPFTACTTGVTYAGPLTAGHHVFQVRAVSIGGAGPAASWAWTISPPPPPSACSQVVEVDGQGQWTYVDPTGHKRTVQASVEADCDLIGGHSTGVYLQHAQIQISGDGSTPTVNADADNVTAVTVTGSNAVITGSYNGTPFTVTLYAGGSRGSTLQVQYGSFNTASDTVQSVSADIEFS